MATDRDPAMVAATAANAARAEVDQLLTVEKRVVSHLAGRTGAGLVITNPPYGKRLGSARLVKLYGRLGAVVRERLPEFDLAVLTAHRKLASEADGRSEPVLSFRHGGLGVKLYVRRGERPAESPSDRRQDQIVTAGGDQSESTVG